MRRMRRNREQRVLLPALACLALAWIAAGCRPQPVRFFQVVDIGEAKRLIGIGETTVIEAVDRGTDIAEIPRGATLRWPVDATSSPATPEIPQRPALIVAPTLELGYRSAAALARNGHVQVVLVIADSAEKRRALWAQTTAREEDAGERDS
jgi:hypothetical protein